MKFAQFMSSTTGRVIRAIAGLIIIALGILMGSALGYIIAVVGLVPLAAGVFDFCLFGPMIKQPFSGKAIRACKVD